MINSDVIISQLNNAGISFRVKGNRSLDIIGFSSINRYQRNTITWLRDYSLLDKYEHIQKEPITCLITNDHEIELPFALCQIWVKDPRDAFFRIAAENWGSKEEVTISPSAIIENGAEIGEGTSIGAFAFISKTSKIGKDCKIGNHVSIKGKVHIGDGCIIQSGAVIGENGFAFTKNNGELYLVEHFGGVYIGDDVLIGSCTCIVQGTIDDTVICSHAKIDNLCHIAHNVYIGERTQIIAGSVVMGSVHIGKNSWVAPSVIRDQKKVGDECVIGMGSVVVKDIPDGMTVAGNPAVPFARKEEI